jgi:hypothetical protein
MFEKQRAAATQRSAERRRREDDATRLKKEVPGLLHLRIAVTETGGLGASKHSRHIMVPTAPALFVFTCGNEQCRDGGHDVTTSALYSLRGLRTTFTEHHECDGNVGSATCKRSIDAVFFAEYS